jgi:hypothetical protein
MYLKHSMSHIVGPLFDRVSARNVHSTKFASFGPSYFEYK